MLRFYRMTSDSWSGYSSYYFSWFNSWITIPDTRLRPRRRYLFSFRDGEDFLEMIEFSLLVILFLLMAMLLCYNFTIFLESDQMTTTTRWCDTCVSITVKFFTSPLEHLDWSLCWSWWYRGRRKDFLSFFWRWWWWWEFSLFFHVIIKKWWWWWWCEVGSSIQCQSTWILSSIWCPFDGDDGEEDDGETWRSNLQSKSVGPSFNSFPTAVTVFERRSLL